MMKNCVPVIVRIAAVAVALGGSVMAAIAGQPRLDAESCKQLHVEQSTFVQSGILADLQRGAAWGKANLSADRLREIEHYIMLDEQIKFACREATLTPEMERASEIAKRIEANPNVDPFAPLPDPDATRESGAADADDGGEPSRDAEQRPRAKTTASERPAANVKPKPVKKPKDDAFKPDVPKPEHQESEAHKSDTTNPEANARTVPLTTEPIR